MADRQDMERRRRDWDREERLRREHRGPQGFAREDWNQTRRAMRPVQNPLDEQDDYSMRYREDWEDEDDWGWRAERERWMDYGRDYDPRFRRRHPDWRQRGERFRREGPWQERYDEHDFQPWEQERSEHPGKSRGRYQQDWDDYEMDYGRGVYDQRRGRTERGRHDWDEGRRYQGRDFESYGPREERGYGDIRGRGYGWEGRHMDPYNRGFFRTEEGTNPDYMERYDETRVGDEWDTGEDLEGDFAYSYTEFWLTPGPFSGMGPKGYQRSDDRIFEDICYRMSVDGQLDPSEVDVKVDDGEVTLEGRVQDRYSKRLAEDIAESVSGVKDIHNRIKVGERQEQHQSGTREGTQQQQTTARSEEMDQ
jgi:hypothetical protein